MKFKLACCLLFFSFFSHICNLDHKMFKVVILSSYIPVQCVCFIFSHFRSILSNQKLSICCGRTPGEILCLLFRDIRLPPYNNN